MAYTLVQNTSAFSGDGNTVTTSAVDTSGASLLAVYVAYDAGTAPTPTDSKSNTWTGLTVQTGTFGRGRWFYVANPAVGSGHTVTLTAASSFPTICFYSFAGAATVSPFDVENGAQSIAVTSASPGSITPSNANELILIGLQLEQATTSLTIDGTGFTITDQVPGGTGPYYGANVAYKIQTSATAENRTWSWSGIATGSTAIASFKAAGAGAVVTHFLSSLGVG